MDNKRTNALQQITSLPLLWRGLGRLSVIICCSFFSTAGAQSLLYPSHFDLQEVTLLDGPMKTAMDKNIEMLMQYDTDRLLTPFVRQAGLSATTDTKSAYYRWKQKHPNFKNWGGDAGFDLSGHVGGHYLSALALAYAASHDKAQRARLKERMDYMLQVMKDCQDQYDNNTEGLYGFIGGQPINDSWKALYAGDLSKIRGNWGWVPFYCQHKVLAGLRDAYIYGGSSQARDMFRKLSDWSVNLIAKVSEADLQDFLNCEHGGMNESLLDAYQLFGDKKYLTAAKRYSHKAMLNGMQILNTSFLDGKHANTQVPKYIGFERIFEQDAAATRYKVAAENFWRDVTQNRTVCIGGNSVNEHFLARANGNRYIDQPDGPESCNTNNMLKFSEMLFDRTAATDVQAAAKYADFYEQAMWNHILSTQDPETGGYVYFTTLRPQGYRIYSQPNKGMWCCVGTGMENHSKYGHFIYTHKGKETLYVNLFTPSFLVSDDFVVTQETQFPNQPTTTLTIGKAGQYTIAVRHPAWAGDAFSIAVNGSVLDGSAVKKGTASYVTINRKWKKGDKVEITLPMELRYEACPNYEDYIAFKYGPILLAANSTNGSEKLQNEYGGEGRMDHSPGAMGRQLSLMSAPLLIGSRDDVLNRIKPKNLAALTFTIDATRPEMFNVQRSTFNVQWTTLTLQPFYQIHHDRYVCYWYQQTEQNFRNSSMAADERAAEQLQQRTLDFVAPGEQQSEAGHEYNYSSNSSKGNYNGESYRDAQANGYIQYSLYNKQGVKDSLAIMLRFTTADKGRKGTLTVDGVKIADITIPADVKGAQNGFFNIEYAIPAELAVDKNGRPKDKFVVRLTASPNTLIPGLYYMRLVRGHDPNQGHYRFSAADWVTGDEGRVSASNINYDTQQNIIHVKASGQNNIALMLDYSHVEYTIDKAQTYLLVRGTNLRTGSSDSYLWWLNGTNKGSQVAPTIQKTITIDGQRQQVIAWDMTRSGLYTNFSGDRPDICQGQTIFGLTSTTGQSDILDINFVEDVNQYLTATSITPSTFRSAEGKNVQCSTFNVPLGRRTLARQERSMFNVLGLKVAHPTKPGLYLTGGKVIAVTRP